MASGFDGLQAALTGVDTTYSWYWREEDRRWRKEDVEWRKEDLEFREFEREQLEEERRMRELEIIWRREDIEQRHVENARYIWARFVEKNRRDVEEKSEQLKAISNLAALFAGFAVVSLTQFNFNSNVNSTWIIAIYGVLTAIAVCLHTISMVLCTLILGCILKIGKTFVNEQAEEEFIFKCKEFVEREGWRVPPKPVRTFENFWNHQCEPDWKLAFNLFTWGVFSFLVELIPIGWIKFYYSDFTAITFMVLTILTIVVWAWKQGVWGGEMMKGVWSGELYEHGASRVMAARDLPGLPFGWHIDPNRTSADAPPGHSFAAATSSVEGSQGPPPVDSGPPFSGSSFLEDPQALERATSELQNDTDDGGISHATSFVEEYDTPLSHPGASVNGLLRRQSFSTMGSTRRIGTSRRGVGEGEDMRLRPSRSLSLHHDEFFADERAIPEGAVALSDLPPSSHLIHQESGEVL